VHDIYPQKCKSAGDILNKLQVLLPSPDTLLCATTKTAAFRCMGIAGSFNYW